MCMLAASLILVRRFRWTDEITAVCSSCSQWCSPRGRWLAPRLRWDRGRGSCSEAEAASRWSIYLEDYITGNNYYRPQLFHQSNVNSLARKHDVRSMSLSTFSRNCCVILGCRSAAKAAKHSTQVFTDAKPTSGASAASKRPTQLAPRIDYFDMTD